MPGGKKHVCVQRRRSELGWRSETSSAIVYTCMMYEKTEVDQPRNTPSAQQLQNQLSPFVSDERWYQMYSRRPLV